MTLALYFNFTWTFVAALALALAFVSGSVETIPLIATMSLGALILWTRLRLGILLTTALTVGMLALGVLRYRESGDLLFIVTYTLAGALPLALERRDRPGGNWSALLAHFFLSLASLAAGDTAIEYLLFLAFCSACVFLLNAGHLFFHRGPLEAKRTRLPSNYFTPFTLSVAGGLILGIILFVFFPRSLQWQNPLAIRQKGGLTGYSGTISLDGGPIRESTALALTVESTDALFLAGTGPRLHFRANVVDRFDGVNWRPSRATTVPMYSPSALKWSKVTLPTPRPLRLYRETHSPRAVIYPGVLIDIRVPNRLLGGLRQDELGNLTRTNDEAIRYSYEITTLPLAEPPTISWKEAAEGASKVDAEYRVIPEAIKTAPWFRDWIARTSGPTPLLGTALADVDAHFQSLFTATYRHEFSPGNTLESFLVRDRRGHCEYFATAGALWLRAQGLASRVALGYRGGQYNSVSGVLEVREANAHAWVEVYAGPARGWVLWDPTPNSAPLFPDNFLTRAREYATAIRFWFERYVVEYNTATQRELIKEITELRSWKPTSRPKLDWRIVPLALFLGVVLWRWRKRRARARRASLLPPYYRTFLAGVAKTGAKRRTGETFARFHDRLVEDGFPKDLVSEVDAALEHDLYGPPGPRPRRTTLAARIEASQLERIKEPTNRRP